MSHWLKVGFVATTILAAAIVLRAQDNPDKKEMKDQEKEIRLVMPWKHISGLTDDQKAQIKEIHQRAVDEMKAIREREKSEIMAVLTDEQKTELAELQEKEKAEQKMKEAEKKEKQKQEKSAEAEKPAEAPAP